MVVEAEGEEEERVTELMEMWESGRGRATGVARRGDLVWAFATSGKH